MRAYCVLLVVAIALFTGTDASEQSANVKIASPNAPGLDRAPIRAEDDVPTSRFLRKSESAGEIDEERGFKGIVDKALRKTKKLSQYNKWIFANKNPAWVQQHFPKYAKGYGKFWANRMVRGGKYN
jgi:hypothetical protein